MYSNPTGGSTFNSKFRQLSPQPKDDQRDVRQVFSFEVRNQAKMKP